MRITKKITSIVLAVLMVVSMMSVMAVTANAAVGDYVAEKDYLTFTSQQDESSVMLSNVQSGSDFQYNKNGDGWHDYNPDDYDRIYLNKGEYVRFRGSNTISNYAGGSFSIGGKVAASGNIMSLRLDSESRSQGLTDACFHQMFDNCEGLITAPDLPETTLAEYCYEGMFNRCRNLTTAPELPAETLTRGCYSDMFRDCSSLTAAPALPATSLAYGCYHGMFEGCTSLTELPELPATSLAEACYYGMFDGCSSIRISDEAGTINGIKYSEAYRIPTAGDATNASSALNFMFASTGGKFKGTPNINTTYYIGKPVYTVTWKNGDTVIETDTDVAEGATPTYNGKTPEKAEDETNTYTFSGWSPAIAPVTADVTYTAQFTATPKTVYVAQVGETKYETLADAFAAAQDGDKITVLADCAGNGIKVTPAGKFANKGLTVDFNNHTYTVDGETVGSTGTETNGFQLLKNNNIAFKNGTITSAKAKILVQNYSNLELSNMTLTLNNPNYTQGYTLSDNNGIVTINNTTINANPEGGYAFDVCRFSSYPSVTVIVTGGSVINGDVEISASKSDPKDGFTLSLQSGTLNGNIVIDPTAQTAMAADTENSGIAKTSTFSQDAPEGYRWTDAGEGMQVLTAIPYVAQIGSTKYETLEEAFAAAQDGNTIEVLADCAGNGIKVLKNTFATGLTVDFGGHTYTVDGETVGSPGTETLAFQLQYGNNITFKNGTLYSEKAKMLVQNYSNLTLDGMKLTFNNTSYNGAYTLSNNNGNTVIKDTTINANPTPGSFAFDVCRGGGSNLYPSVNVTVTGNSVINGNVEVYAKNADPKDGFSLTLASGTMTGNIVVDPTAKAVLDAKSDKGEVTKNNAFGQTAPEGLVWEDNGNGTSSLVPVEVNPLDALITRVSDGNKFGITSQYYAGTILGVQKKEKITNAAVTSDKGTQEAAEGSDMRFVAVLDTETLQGADDYGFVLAKVGSDKDIASVGNEGLDKLKKGDDRFKTISAVNTYNTVCGTTAAAKKYGDPTDATTAYKYITCAVNGVDDSSKIVARFYVVKDGKTYYAKYAGHSYKYRGAVAGISDLG